MQSNVKRPVHVFRAMPKQWETGGTQVGVGGNTPIVILVGVFWQRSCCLKYRRNHLIFYYKTLLGSGHLTVMLAKVEW